MEQLIKAFESLNMNIDEATRQKFKKFMELVLEWNEKVNLTSITDKKDFVKKHFVDSIICAGFDEIKGANSIIDVGTGAGFPGVPLALVFPEKRFSLIDATRKKIQILNGILETLEIPNVELRHGRAEELSRNEAYSEKFDLCVSRAVANLKVLVAYCLPFVTIDGCFFSYKGSSANKEAKESESVIKSFGGEIIAIRKVKLEGFDLDHNIVVIKKVKRK